MLTKEDVRNVYLKRAEKYDFTVQLHRLLGFRMDSYREQAIEPLH
jgi:hypothetical protein